MTTKWNWQRIVTPGVEQLNLPKFKKSVLLADRRKNKTYAIVGNLETLDIDGPHWSTGTDLFGEIFGTMFTSRDMKYPEHFKPTHWCEIELPDYEEPQTDGKVG
jgi:hypothetical protein